MKLALVLVLMQSSHGFAHVGGDPVSDLRTQSPAAPSEAVAALLENEKGELCYLNVTGHPELVPPHMPTAPDSAAVESNVGMCDGAVTSALRTQAAAAIDRARVAVLGIAAVLPMVCGMGLGVGIVNAARELKSGRGDVFSGSDGGFYSGLGAAAVLSRAAPVSLIAAGTALSLTGAVCAMIGEFGSYQVYYYFRPKSN